MLENAPFWEIAHETDIMDSRDVMWLKYCTWLINKRPTVCCSDGSSWIMLRETFHLLFIVSLIYYVCDLWVYRCAVVYRNWRLIHMHALFNSRGTTNILSFITKKTAKPTLLIAGGHLLESKITVALHIKYKFPESEALEQNMTSNSHSVDISHRLRLWNLIGKIGLFSNPVTTVPCEWLFTLCQHSSRNDHHCWRGMLINWCDE